ncbi:MAG: hypothetical protein J1F37_02500 [Oscillospiraceae bacterium]|nr:hypothetical protein [Oscillospiraceae bacterium]
MEINLKNAKKMQTLKGFGTSACWWSQYCKGAAAEKIAELLYGKTGLGLNIYRYNIGGGTDETNCRITNPWRKTESMYVWDKESKEGVYDYSQDKTAVDFMKLCLSKGNIDTLILFANSPHWSLTSTGQTSGSLLEHTCNIPKMNYRKFADIVLNITEHFLNEGLPVKYISPINEPQWKWGGDNVWQEGCHYETEEVIEIYHIFAEEIIKRRLPVKLYGPESGEMLGMTENYLNAMLADETIMSVTDIFAYHSYHSDNCLNTRITFKNDFVTKHPELRFDMSEWCELPNESHTKNFKGALITARIIGQDLIFGGAESWTAWVAVNQTTIREDGFDYADAMLSSNDDFSQWYIAERYYAMAHFAKFIPVGSVCLDTGFFPEEDNSFNVFSFLAPENKTVTVIVNETEEKEITLNGNFSKMKIILSTQNEKMKEISIPFTNGKITCPKNSIVTVVGE